MASILEHQRTESERFSDIARPSGIGVWLTTILLTLIFAPLVGIGMAVFQMGRAIGAVFGSVRYGTARVSSTIRRISSELITIDPMVPKPGPVGGGNRSEAPHPEPNLTERTPVPASTHAAINDALAPFMPKGGAELPEDVRALATLLLDPPPSDDFRAADMVRACFEPMPDGGSRSAALLGVATRLALHFGSPIHLPMATTLAWRMLDRDLAETESAAQLLAISRFIDTWQKTQQTFLCLHFSEIELIELLFESLHPGRHAEILTKVLSFKVLSNRRQGLLRRIPHRTRKITAASKTNAADARNYLEGTRAFLDGIVSNGGYLPIVEAATTALSEIDKIIEAAQPPPVAASPQDGQALARITPVKRSAAELAEAAVNTRLAAASAPIPPTSQTPTPAPPQAHAPVLPVLRSPSLHSRATPATLLSPPHFTIRTPWGRLGLRVVHASPPARPKSVHIAVAPQPQRLRMIAVARQETASVPILASATLPAPSVSAPPPSDGIVVPTPVEKRRGPRNGRKPRISAEVKRKAALHVLHGDDPVAIAHSLGIDRAVLDEWVATFVVAGSQAFSTSRGRKIPPHSAEFLRLKLAEVLTTVQMIERAINADRPRQPVKLVSARQSGQLLG